MGLGYEHSFVVEHPSEMSHGDYSTNVALIEAKKLGKNPKELAEEYILVLRQAQEAFDFLEKIESAGPGFINFYLKPEFFSHKIGETLEHKDFWGSNQILGREKTIVEYTNCNVLKPMHIGHLMGNVIGESLSRILEANGAEVKRDTYQGDSGLHIAKVIWGIMQLGGKTEGTLSEKVEYVGRAYALGANSYEDDEKAKGEIIELNKKIFKKTDDNLNMIYQWGRKISLDHFEELYKKLGTKFDFYFFESEVADDALKIVKEFLAKGVFEESEGAIVFKGEKYDSKLHTRVFIGNQGIPMYEAKDIAHAIRKYNTYQSQKSIIITANEQDSYFKVVLRALQEINLEIAQQTEHFSHGLLKLADGKMSSRKGNVITGESLINDIQEAVIEKISDRDFSDQKKNEIAEIVAIGALKYSILRQATGKDIIFDFDKSLSFEGDSGPYLQYSYVRAQSILRKAEEAKIEADESLPENWAPTLLEKLIARFGEVVAEAGENFSPHTIATYLIELAAAFNGFYAVEKIVDASDANSPYKVAMTAAFAQTMKNGLHMLGIKVPEEM